MGPGPAAAAGAERSAGLRAARRAGRWLPGAGAPRGDLPGRPRERPAQLAMELPPRLHWVRTRLWRQRARRRQVWM
ncbi:unnamed protein product, partial [Lepidochelys kempii]